ncbi:MAG: DUF5719 family protein [Pseudolysinimonas sp.]
MPEPTDDIRPEEIDPADAAQTDPEVAARDEADQVEAARSSGAARAGARRAAILGLRLVAGVVALGAAAATVAAVGLIPFPSIGIKPPAATVTPVPADQVRACAGGALRLGDETGADADTPVRLGQPAVRSDAVGATLKRTSPAKSEAGAGGTPAAPQVLRIDPADGADLAGAQSQAVAVRDFVGFTAAACAEPSGSIWLVGGATTTGRTSILTITNPTDVAAQVSLQIFGEDGAVEAPGMSGIDVPAGSQRVLSLAGFAPGVLSPVVHVEARGGRVVAYLQQSIVRGLDATGMDLIGASPDPAPEQIVPGVRILDSVATNRALALEDWDDATPIVRIFNPGADALEVTVGVIPVGAEGGQDAQGTGFPIEAEPGVVTEVPLDAGIEVDTGVALADGVYTVTMSADRPFLGAVRTTAAQDIGPIETDAPVAAPPTDFAWYAAAPELTGDALVVVAPGPAAVLAAVNPGSADVTVTLDAQGGGEDLTLDVPAGGSASIPVVAGTAYLLTGATGLRAAISYAADDAMGAYPLASARPVSGPIVIRP